MTTQRANGSFRLHAGEAMELRGAENSLRQMIVRTQKAIITANQRRLVALDRAGGFANPMNPKEGTQP
jgi:hypothetical protein